MFDGILGVGKSSLIEYMAQHFEGVVAVRERLSPNCLKMFDAGMAQQVRDGTIGEGLVIPGATRSQISFLGLSLADALNVVDSPRDNVFIQERCPRSHFRVFATTQKDLGYISGADFGTIREAAEAQLGYVRQPDAYFGFDISLKGLHDHLKERGKRSDRPKMDPNNPYLERLLVNYRRFFRECGFDNVAVIDTTGKSVSEVGEEVFSRSNGIFRRKAA